MRRPARKQQRGKQPGPCNRAPRAHILQPMPRWLARHKLFSVANSSPWDPRCWWTPLPLACVGARCARKLAGNPSFWTRARMPCKAMPPSSQA
eukprot:9850642-Lingulodinium_polyedra.AAC.1